MRLIASLLSRWFLTRTTVALDYIPRAEVVSGYLPRADVQSYLDEAIAFWRARRKEEGRTPSAALAQGYVDAFQSARVSLIGEALPEVKP